MGFLSGVWSQLSPSLLAAWVFLVELVPNKEVVLKELAVTKEAFGDLYEWLLVLAANRVAITLISIYIIYKVYTLLFRSFEHKRLNHEVGYIPENARQSHALRAEDVRRRRRTGDLPPVYPNGWFWVMNGRDLAFGTSKQASLLGLELAVYRTDSGKVAILDAYCPHLGANLAAGGSVEGDNLHCPFHGWQFNTEGVCVKIPYCDSTIPTNASVKKYTSLETNGQILLWYDAEGREPFWYPPELPGVNNGDWRFCGETLHTLNCHIEEVPENAADVPHLEYLHGPFMSTGTDLRNTQKMKVIRHKWTASWAPCEEEGKKHLSVLNLLHELYIFGFRFGLLDFRVVATQIGPGLVYLTWKSFLGEGCFVQSLTPTEPLLQSLSHCVYASWTVPTWMAKFYMFGEVVQVERDVMVWNNKMYRKSPLLCKEDTLIKKHRMWYSQFFSEHSPRYEDIKNNSTSW